MATRSRPEPPICKRAPKFVIAHHGRSVFAPMTGQDARAFHAFVHLLDCFSACDTAGRLDAIIAMHHTIACMQPHVRWIAKAAIPCALDWGDEEPLWRKILDAGDSLDDTPETRQ